MGGILTGCGEGLFRDTIYLRLPDDLKMGNIENIVNLILLMTQSCLLKPRRVVSLGDNNECSPGFMTLNIE
uniref:Uncharacterized protein n=1 Tax=Magallana gigas TaxID=29159 RepID=K1Q561_MAGGI